MVIMRILLSLLLVFAALAPALAQTTPPPAGHPAHQNPPRTPEQELKALSGELKDLHGQVHQSQGAIDRQLTAGPTERNREKLVALQEELKEANADLEQSLQEVNARGAADLEMIREKAERTMERTRATLERVKGLSTSAVN
jgi:hypothetical protein